MNRRCVPLKRQFSIAVRISLVLIGNSAEYAVSTACELATRFIDAFSAMAASCFCVKVTGRSTGLPRFVPKVVSATSSIVHALTAVWRSFSRRRDGISHPSSKLEDFFRMPRKSDTGERST